MLPDWAHPYLLVPGNTFKGQGTYSSIPGEVLPGNVDRLGGTLHGGVAAQRAPAYATHDTAGAETAFLTARAGDMRAQATCAQAGAIFLRAKSSPDLEECRPSLQSRPLVSEQKKQIRFLFSRIINSEEGKCKTYRACSDGSTG